MTTNRKAASPSKAGTLGETASNSQANSKTSPIEHQDQNASLGAWQDQENMLLNWLKTEPGINTLDARRRGINHPAGRIQGLKRRGHLIDNHWTDAVSQNGKITRVAFYVMRKSQQRSLLDLLEEMRDGGESEKGQ